MKKTYMLTKDNCSFCEKAKQYLEKTGLIDEIEDLQVVHKESDEKLFETLKEEHNISTVPAFIRKDGSTLQDSKGSNIRKFLNI